MHSDTRRNRHLLLIIMLSVLALLLLARPAHAGWSADPVEVHATSALCPLVSACDDARYGAIVVWQENTSTGGLLKARHLLANGDADPTWTAPVVVSTADIARTALGAVSDDAGGAYVWWMEHTRLYLTRVSPSGGIAAGWPARGRILGTLAGSGQRPSVAGDGSGGLYLAWVESTLAPAGTAVVRAAHLGPSNTGKGGWTNGARSLGTAPDASELANSAAIATAPDGGLWLAFAATTFSDPVYVPGDVRVLRLTSAGLPAAGWDAHGESLSPFRGDLLTESPLWGPVPGMSLVAIASDGGSGAYVMAAEVAGDASGVTLPAYRLWRAASDGAVAPGWSPAGIPITNMGSGPDRDYGSGSSLRTMADGRGGVFAGTPGFFTEFLSAFEFERRSAAGDVLPGGVSADQLGLEYANRGDGGMYIASFHPSGATSFWSPNAYVRAAQSHPGTGFAEYHDTPSALWFGDVGLTATGDGGAIFVWSQVNARFGVYAVRLSPGGVVTGVPPERWRSGAAALRLRFVPGAGVEVWAGAIPGGRVELALHDASGRCLARSTFESSDPAGRLWPGTANLPSGVYFARGMASGTALSGRVAVLR